MTDTYGDNSWIVVHNPNFAAKLRLFCFPFVGGDPRAFVRWAHDLPLTVEVCALNFPGRGTRFREPLFTQINPLIDAIMPALYPYLDRPFVFFGHSMGSILSFEVARRLRRERGLSPLYLFISARHAPQRKHSDPPSYSLPQAQFIERLRMLKGTPEELLQNPELMRLVSVILRADFEINDNYLYSAEPPLAASIKAYGGLDDPYITRTDLEAWQEQTSGSFSVEMLPGGHFFTESAHDLLMESIRATLQSLLSDFSG